ncbi:acylphosphatase [Roseivirga sp.]|uniref:acylphosphatase n=1 Tax=Roseivirga sp. TaxID=1964215 RepID=UPI002B26CD27|nr:acylphosphatase [Roseivirga sp.]
MQAKRIKVTGKVQGVYFRASSQEQARRLGIKGWCKNEPDGSVLIIAEGSDENLNALVSWCHHGPSNASVEKVLVESIEASGFEGFEIKR